VRFLLAALAFTVFASAAKAAPPQWYLDEIKSLSAAGGRWIADNSAYKSEIEPFDSYGTEWKSGFDGDTMVGRLFGFRDGKQTTFDFWEFRQYWHPGRIEAVIEQFGWGGAIGVGALEEDGDGSRSDQTFYSSDGTLTRTGHKSRFADANTYVTESFDIVDGEWRPRRKYVWRRLPSK
jgi:hypothetical protein